MQDSSLSCVFALPCKFQFIVLLENAVGNAVLSVPKEFWGSMPQNSYDFHDLQYKYMPLRGRNAEDSVPYGMLEKLQFILLPEDEKTARFPGLFLVA